MARRNSDRPPQSSWSQPSKGKSSQNVKRILLTPELSEEKAPAWHLQAARLVRRLTANFNSPALVL
jgi:hypothetical protein